MGNETFVDHKMPLEQICQLFTDLYGYALNSETVETALEQGYELTAPLEAATLEALKRAKVVHFDETGLRIGENCTGCIRPAMPATPICLFTRNAGSSAAQRGVGVEGFQRSRHP